MWTGSEMIVWGGSLRSFETTPMNIYAEGGRLRYGVLYLLSFEGKKEVAYEGSETDALQTFPLTDSRGREFIAVFAGSPTKDGALSQKEWKYSGQLEGRDGKWVFVGTLLLPEPKLTLIYAVPKNASGLTLKDRERRHQIN